MLGMETRVLYTPNKHPSNTPYQALPKNARTRTMPLFRRHTMVNLDERHNHQLMDQNQGQRQVRREVQTQTALSRQR